MNRRFDDLLPAFRPIAFEFFARCEEAGFPVRLIGAGRTPEAQAELYAQGRTKPGRIVTWTLDSKHVFKGGYCRAFDCCLWEQFNLHGADKLAWSPDEPAWQTIGNIGQRLGLKWGIVGKDGQRRDLGHFEWVGEE